MHLFGTVVFNLGEIPDKTTNIDRRELFFFILMWENFVENQNGVHEMKKKVESHWFGMTCGEEVLLIQFCHHHLHIPEWSDRVLRKHQQLGVRQRMESRLLEKWQIVFLRCSVWPFDSLFEWWFSSRRILYLLWYPEAGGVFCGNPQLWDTGV